QHGRSKGTAPTELFFQWSGVPYVGDSGQRAATFVERLVLLISPRWGLGKIFDTFIYKGAAPMELLFLRSNHRLKFTKPYLLRSWSHHKSCRFRPSGPLHL